MSKPALTEQSLIDAGFVHGGAWIETSGRLDRQGRVPATAGVYAFVHCKRVMYVGLASAGLAKRLYGYANPSASQRTNVRLNGTIASAIAQGVVDIYFACPPDHEWNGLTIKGAHGLEAGILATFELPWNMVGQAAVPPPQVRLASIAAVPDVVDVRRPARSLREQVEQAVRSHPRSTEAEIARIVFGRSGYQQKVNPVCRALVHEGRFRRLGLGGASDPFVYLYVG